VGSKLSPKDLELYQRTDEVLHYLWDPCGVSDAPEARDEYFGYLPVVFNLLKNGAEADAIAKYLFSVETERMGATGNLDSLQKIDWLLVSWRERIFAADS